MAMEVAASLARQGEESPRFWSSYEVDSILGRGQRGVVWRCKERSTGRTFACKELLQLTPATWRCVREEIDAMRALSGHPNVVRLHQVFEEDNRAYLVTELGDQGDLFDAICSSHGGLEEREARSIFIQLAAAVRHCHRGRILHRDIKPENVFLSAHSPIQPRGSTASAELVAESHSVTAKLGDFGLARRLPERSDGITGRAGSVPYCAPEVQLHERYSFPADIWSLGVLLHAMLTGAWPEFDDEGGLELSGHGVQASAEALLRGMLALEPEARPSIHGVLAHPWLGQGTPLPPGQGGSPTTWLHALRIPITAP